MSRTGLAHAPAEPTTSQVVAALTPSTTSPTTNTASQPTTVSSRSCMKTWNARFDATLSLRRRACSVVAS